MATPDKIDKLSYNDAFMLEKLVDSINYLIEMVEYLDKRIDHHWQYHRMKDKENKEGHKGNKPKK